MDILAFSQQTKQHAENLLEYGNVLSTLLKLGEVHVSGSYQYNLMYGPDIDLIVLSDTPEQSSYQALLDFIQQKKFQKYELGDFSTFPRKGRPKAMIVVLVHEYEGRRWEIEIWFKKSHSKDDTSVNKLLSHITEEQRMTILKLKRQRDEKKISKDQLSSVEIYKGVLLEGKNELGEFWVGF